MSLSPRFLQTLSQYVVERLPIRVLKVPERQLMDHSAVIAYLSAKLVLYDDIFIKKEADQLEMSEVEYIAKMAARETTYIVLSHTWLPDQQEVTYEDTISYPDRAMKGVRLLRGGLQGAGYQKLVSFCDAVHTFATEFAWADTVCINKGDPDELQESISSMFKWYARSSTCIVYLAATTCYEDMPFDRWFTRGWTLQELVAPRITYFYTKEWTVLDFFNTQTESVDDLEDMEIMAIIQRATNISPAQIHGFMPGFDEGIASRLAWLQNRVTTKPEDIVYSITGLFNVRMSIAYGEGKKLAFFRFMKQILSNPGVFPHTLSILNWAGGLPVDDGIHPSNVIPAGPECYYRHNVDLNINIKYIPQAPLSLDVTHKGLRVPLLLVFSQLIREDAQVEQEKPLSFFIAQNTHDKSKVWEDIVNVRLLDNSPQGRAAVINSNFHLFGIWTFKTKGEEEVIVPHTCSAFLFAMTSNRRRLSASNFPDETICAKSKINTQDVIILKTVKPSLKEVRFGIPTLARNYNLRLLREKYI